MKTWTVKDLLYKTFEFREMVPNSNEWNESSLKYNEPRLIRFRRLNALLKAFGLTRTKKQKNSLWTMLSGKKRAKEDELTKSEITPFLRGDFILKRESTKYPRVQELIEKEKSSESDPFNEPRDVYTFYNHLMKYRIEIDNVLRHNSVVLEASSLGFRSAITLTAELNNDLYKKAVKIDELLFEIINPNDLSFDEETLIKEYGFPKENLNAIDVDNY
ncbi:hypothetical protein ABHQ57_14725 [Tenacibaculum sp. ZH5_bin.1]|uniref:hypothetical protein n=1 Tax=Tenacibaculum TaxID=104267 RepID=UPI001430EA0C|nr:hypothetical protein [Tenacibaculum mesophilum]KAF9658333.1 hypothetical protein HBA12_14170 [Tenacibaculum mesophilum]